MGLKTKYLILPDITLLLLPLLLQLKIKYLSIINISLLQNLITAKNFTARLAQANLTSKNDIANFVKKTDFDDQLKHLNKKFTSYKIKHVLIENELSELSEKVKAISTKGLTKDLIINYSILIGTKYFYQEHFQIIWYLHQLKNTLNTLITRPKLICGNLMECQKKVSKI